MAAASTSKQTVSGRLQGLRFMQRAKLREEVLKKQEADEAVEASADESHWVTPAASSGCRVIVEGDPKPGAILGRMSFQNFNPTVEKIVEEAEAKRERVRDAASTPTGEDTSTVKAAQQAERNGGDSGAAGVADTSNLSMRKRLKVEKQVEKVTVVKTETTKVNIMSNANANVKTEADRRLQQHVTKQVKSNRDWRHLRPPGH